MRKLIVTEFLALDGVFEEPGDWPKGFWNDEIAKFKEAELRATDALLLGRTTYDGFAAAWPNMEETEGEFAKRMNSMPKYVVSKSMKKADWNNTTIIHDDVADEIRKLKKEKGKQITIHGSGELIHSLLPEDVIDEIFLLVYPFMLGKGKKLFREGPQTIFKLVKTKKYNTGVVLLHYSTKI